ncbi:SRPBCC family protein [Pseudomonas sp. dw_358]|uniref:SRPBCC family protein n=1 Tax=Pseudomonas sp. dw_358 TaxID=2720083 RepID=UPI001BD56D1F|nr:SRPBCC family protein [Pseudomonas sp. dw_358]
MLEQSVGEIYIEASINQVYDYATQPEHWSDWHPTSLRADAGDGGTPPSDTQFEEVVDLMGDELTLTHRVVLDERPVAFETQFTSLKGEGRVRYDLHHQGSGTLFKRTLTFALTEPQPKLSGRLPGISEQAMANLKRRVEALPGA